MKFRKIDYDKWSPFTISFESETARDLEFEKLNTMLAAYNSKRAITKAWEMTEQAIWNEAFADCGLTWDEIMD